MSGRRYGQNESSDRDRSPYHRRPMRSSSSTRWEHDGKDRRSTRERGHFSGRVSLGNRGRGRSRCEASRQEEPSQNEQLNKHNYPGRDVLTKVQADNMRKYSPLATKYSTLENSDIAQEIRRADEQVDLPIPVLDPNQTIKGRPIQLKKNEFKVEIINPSQKLYLYTVEFIYDQTARDKPLRKADHRNVIHNAMKDLKCHIAYDGSQLAIMNVEIDPKHRNVIVESKSTTVVRSECTSQKKTKEVQVKFKKVHQLTWEKLERYINGEDSANPTDVIQMLDIILKAQICKDVASIKKGMMVPRGINMRLNSDVLLNEGRQVWNGINQSTRITGWKSDLGSVRMLTLNTDISYTQVMQSVPISELMQKCKSMGENMDSLAASIHHLTIENLANNRHYKFHGFGKFQVRSATCQFERNGPRVSVSDYWNKILMEKTGQGWQFRGDLRTIKISKFHEIPAELCKIIPGQKPKDSGVYSRV